MEEITDDEKLEVELTYDINIITELSYSELNWIKNYDNKYMFIKNNLIDVCFPVLNEKDRELLLKYLVMLINFIMVKFCMLPYKEDMWNQLIQNKMSDLKSLLYCLLPYIQNDVKNNNFPDLKFLKDIYLERDKNDNFIYSNCQYNRCVLTKTGNKEDYYFRPYHADYFIDHFQLLTMSIDACANKLFVNWIDIVPYCLNNFRDSRLYLATFDKFTKVWTEPVDDPNMIMRLRIDYSEGLSYQDIYNIIVNHLYHEVKNYNWVITDIYNNGKIITFIDYLEDNINLRKIWENQSWSQLNLMDRNIFADQWSTFLKKEDTLTKKTIGIIYYYFVNYHSNAEKLIREKKLFLSKLNIEEDWDIEDLNLGVEYINHAKRGLENTPPMEIYFFLNEQLKEFKKTWYYYVLRVKNLRNLYYNDEISVGITMQNVYQYAKSLCHQYQKKMVEFPRFWISLDNTHLMIVFHRLLNIPHDVFNNPKNPWFRISKYLKEIYNVGQDKEKIAEYQRVIHDMLHYHIVDIIFESMIYHGILSMYVPKGDLTNQSYLKKLGIHPDKKLPYLRKKIGEYYFSEDKPYKKNSYYFLTRDLYQDLPNYTYQITHSYDWMFMNALHWITQINIFHHYYHNRVIYITGSTGVGKSSQMPKIFFYAQRVIDYLSKNKVICTEPRINPTTSAAENISNQLGVPITQYIAAYKDNFSTNNYYVQYKHSEGDHVSNISSFLRFTTDGTLLDQMLSYPFFTTKKNDRKIKQKDTNWYEEYTDFNIYDLVIIDEAHEHGINMDIIMTLMRDVLYVNNSVKLVIITATIEDDEPIYRQYFRVINDNRNYPLNAYLSLIGSDRANMDRRLDLDPPGKTTLYPITDVYLPPEITKKITAENYLRYGIDKTLEVIKRSSSGFVLLFVVGQSDVKKAVNEINLKTPHDVIAFGFYADMPKQMKEFILKLSENLPRYTRSKKDVFSDESKITERVPKNTYRRAIIVSTNIAEASVTIENLQYIIDTGFAKKNIFYPLDNYNRLVTTRISKTSSIQRRGRVGRRQPGTIYYLYQPEDVENIRTFYEISNSDISNFFVKLLREDINDLPLINEINDINNINLLNSIRKLKEESETYEDSDLIYRLLRDPRPYFEIIKKKYLLIADPERISYYYDYYGRGENKLYQPSESLESYTLNNYDDYYFKNYRSRYRGFTGYDSHILQDNTGEFYLIHPDENMMERDMFTGKIVSLAIYENNPIEYYDFFFQLNRFLISGEELPEYYIETVANYLEKQSYLIYPKIELVIGELQSQLILIKLDLQKNGLDKYDFSEKAEYLENYRHRLIQSYFNNYPGTTAVRTIFHKKILSFQKISKIEKIENYNDVIWYAYAYAYGIHYDVIAIITLMYYLPDLKKIKISGGLRTISNVLHFFQTHRNKWGDIYFLWGLWIEIKKIIDKLGWMSKIEITEENFFQFSKLKSQYLKKKQNLDYYDFYIFHKLSNREKLNTPDEYYAYVRELHLSDNQIKIPEVYFLSLSERYLVEPTVLHLFVNRILKIFYSFNKNIWLAQKNPVFEEREKEIMTWITDKFRFPRYFPEKDPWYLILETYVRSHSTNVLKNIGNKYININRGNVISFNFWSQNIKKEVTFLNNRSKFVLYHHLIEKETDTTVMYLTFIDLQWVLDLNPILYYYLFYADDNIFTRKNYKESFRKLKKSLGKYRGSVNIDYLLQYLGQLQYIDLSKIIRSNLQLMKKN